MNSVLHQMIISLSREECRIIESSVQRLTLMTSRRINTDIILYLYIGQYYIGIKRYREAYILLQEGITISTAVLGKNNPITLTILYLLLVIGIIKGNEKIVYDIIEVIENNIPGNFRVHFYVLREYVNTKMISKLIEHFEEFGEKNKLGSRSFSSV